MSHEAGASAPIRASTVDGIFYPSDPRQLRRSVEELLGERVPQLEAAQSIIAPHAAFAYSGAVAAAAFEASRGRRVRLAVVLGPVHRDPAEAVLLTESEAYHTPLGAVPVDRELVQALADRGGEFRYDEIPHLEEHCLEIQLPFLQVVHPGARLLPLLVGHLSRRRVEELSGALWELTRDRLESTLFVVSSNLSSFANEEDSEAEANTVLRWIQDGEWEPLVDGPGRKSSKTCGGAGIAAILLLHRHIGGRVAVLERASSLQAGGDPRRVVQYAAVALSANES
jgi:AmmeMemoRadiSam system protein B